MPNTKLKLLFILNVLKPGTGPFQRAIRLDTNKLDVTIVSCSDNQKDLEEKVHALVGDRNNYKLIGLGVSNRIFFIYELCKLILLQKPDIIQVNHTFSSLVAILWGKLIRTPVIVSFEGTLFTRFSCLKRYSLGMIYALTDGVIAVSHTTKKVNSQALGFWNRWINRIVIYNGIDIVDFDEVLEAKNQNYFFDKTTFNIGYVGDLKPVKDVKTLVEAFAIFAKNNIESKLILVGEGELRPELEQIVKREGLVGRVCFTGLIDRKEVYVLLSDIDIFVMPSKVEGLSEAIVQAMTARVPVLVSDIEPNEELVQSSVTGYTFEQGNVVNLATQLELIKNSRAKNVLLVKNARQKIENELDIYRIVESYRQFYTKLYEGKKKP